MYRVFLIDDEPWAMVSLEHLLDWKSLGFEIAGKIDNARLAWEQIQTEKPDVIITDIRMPGLGGLELLHLIREAALPVEVVLVSAFADFSYAQEAIRMGAREYLLKPVRRDKLTECIQQLHIHLEKRRQLTPPGWNALIRQQSLREFCLSLTGQNPPASAALLHCTAAFSALLPHALPGMIGKADLPDGETLWLCDASYAEELAAVCEQTARHSSLKGAWGLSCSQDMDENLPTLMWQVRIARDSAAFAGCSGLRYRGSEQSFSQEFELFKALRYDQKDMILTHLDTLRKEVMTGQVMLDKLMNLLQTIGSYYLHTQDKPALFPSSWMHYPDLVRDYPSCSALFDHLRSAFADDPEEALLEPVLRDIEHHYAQLRTLADFAQELGVSQAYLSQLIRRHTGKTYSELVQEKRMEKAKELLAYSDAAVMDIAIQVGYSDQFYFSKLFKRLWGMSPNAWRKSVRSGNEITKFEMK